MNRLVFPSWKPLVFCLVSWKMQHCSDVILVVMATEQSRDVLDLETTFRSSAFDTGSSALSLHDTRMCLLWFYISQKDLVIFSWISNYMFSHTTTLIVDTIILWAHVVTSTVVSRLKGQLQNQPFVKVSIPILSPALFSPPGHIWTYPQHYGYVMNLLFVT